MRKFTDISDDTDSSQDYGPALTPEAAETENIGLAVKLAGKQLRDGTASSQVIVHYLKLGTLERELEVERMKKENALLEAKTKSIKDSARNSEIAKEALEAFKKYTGAFASTDEVIDDGYVVDPNLQRNDR